MEKGKIYFEKIFENIINLNRVAELAQIIEIEREPTLEELLSTIINRDEVEKLIKQPVKIIFSFFVLKFKYILIK
jgi:hypothetical protein